MKALPDFLEPTGETCPSCGWRFDSEPTCCERPEHNVIALCPRPRCERTFISAAAPPLPQVAENDTP